MIAVDTNILLYAHVARFKQHAAARRRLVELAEGAAAWALPIFCVTEFLRVATHRRVLDDPFEPAEACEAMQRLMASPSAVVLSPGERYPDILCDVVRASGARGNLVFDAQIVALCREAGVSTLLTEDRDFDRFAQVRAVRLEEG